MKKISLLIYLLIAFFIMGCTSPHEENKKHCQDSQHARACELVGDDYSSNYSDDVEKNLMTAKEYYALSCEYDGLSYCAKTKHIDNILHLSDKAEVQCKNNNDIESCIAVAEDYSGDNYHIKKDIGKAEKYYALACEYGNSESCKKEEVLAEARYDKYKKWFWYLLGAVFVLFMVRSAIREGIRQNKRADLYKKGQAKARKDLYDKYNFKETNIIYSHDNRSYVSIDEDSKQICFSSNAAPKFYKFKDIMKSEIVENGNTTIETSRGSQVLGAAVGGVLLGGAGLIVGGLSGKKTQKSTIDKIDLVITISDTSKPIHVLHILEEKSGSAYEKKFELARRWHNIIAILIKQSDEEEVTRKANVEKKSSTKAKGETNSSLFIADEIRKLKALKDEGIITEIEFDEKKKQLLAQ